MRKITWRSRPAMPTSRRSCRSSCHPSSPHGQVPALARHRSSSMKFVLALSAAIGLILTTATASAGTGEDLITANKCSKCHTATTTKKAPSFAAIAEKYKGKPEASAAIVEMLKTGGKDDQAKVAASEAA